MASWMRGNYEQNNFNAIQFFSKLILRIICSPAFCSHAANIRFQTLNLTSFHSRSAFLLTGFLICFSRLRLPNIYLPNESTLAQNFPIFQFILPHLLAHENSGSKPCAFWICHELVIQSQNHTKITITIIPRARTSRDAYFYFKFICEMQN